MERKVACKHLAVGMYISKLDRPWIDTPFLMEGLLLKSKKELVVFADYCDFVYIDISRGIEASEYMEDADDVIPQSKQDNELKLPKEMPAYVNKHSAETEMPKAIFIIDKVNNLFRTVLDKLALGAKLDASQIEATVNPLIDSILRNPDAILWLTRLKNRNDKFYDRSITTCTLAIAFGRSLNLPRSELKKIAEAALLLDIGMLKINQELIKKADKLTPEETKEMESHVQHSITAARSISGLNKDVINIIRCHHERHNGSGYPNNLKGKDIPVLARLVAIVDCYVEMTAENQHGWTLSSYQVVYKLYAWRNIAFQHEVVEQFIQCLGPFPTGTLVELSTGEVGIVLSQNSTRSLRPRIMLVLDADKKSYDDYSIVDLMTNVDDAVGKKLEIVKGLDAGTYGIDPKDFYI